MVRFFDMTMLTEQAAQAGAMSRQDVHAPEWRFLGYADSTCPTEQLISASAALNTADDTPRIILVSGYDDEVVFRTQNLHFVQALDAHDPPHESHAIPGADDSLISTTRKDTARALRSTLKRALPSSNQKLNYEDR